MVVTAALSAVIGTLSAGATNIVTYTLLDSVTTTADELIMTFRRICNENDRTNILFDLTSSNSPFKAMRLRVKVHAGTFRLTFPLVTLFTKKMCCC